MGSLKFIDLKDNIPFKHFVVIYVDLWFDYSSCKNNTLIFKNFPRICFPGFIWSKVQWLLNYYCNTSLISKNEKTKKPSFPQRYIPTDKLKSIIHVNGSFAFNRAKLFNYQILLLSSKNVGMEFRNLEASSHGNNSYQQ